MLSRARVRSPARLAKQDQKRLDELLDEALEETFPASHPPAMLEPAPDSQRARKIKIGPAREGSIGPAQPRMRNEKNANLVSQSDLD